MQKHLIFLILNTAIASAAVTLLVVDQIWSVTFRGIKDPAFILYFWTAMSTAGAMRAYTKLTKGLNQPPQQTPNSSETRRG